MLPRREADDSGSVELLPARYVASMSIPAMTFISGRHQKVCRSLRRAELFEAPASKTTQQERHYDHELVRIVDQGLANGDLKSTRHPGSRMTSQERLRVKVRTLLVVDPASRMTPQERLRVNVRTLLVVDEGVEDALRVAQQHFGRVELSQAPRVQNQDPVRVQDCRDPVL